MASFVSANVKPFKATACHNGQFVAGSGQALKGQ